MIAQFLDTQIVSYAFKGAATRDIQGQFISSIVALEFLLVQGEKHCKANYYIPHAARLGVSHGFGVAPELNRRDHPFGKVTTDSMIVDFGLHHPAIVEYSNFAVAQAITQKLDALYAIAVKFHPKDQRKQLLSKFRFLLDNNIACIPIRLEDVNAAFALLSTFLRKHNTKSKFRNTWNDMLILASARSTQLPLLSNDTLLNRVACELWDGKMDGQGEMVRVAFPSPATSEARESKESKGFINKGWNVRFRNLGNNAYRGTQNR